MARRWPPLALALIVFGCGSLGPRTVHRDRFNYSNAIAESSKEEMLLNIVRLRYLDLPTFVDVGSIVSGYTLSTGAGGSVAPYDARSSLRIDGNFRYEERPTISYEILSGSDFAAALLEPIPVNAIWALIEAGYDARLLLSANCRSINGLYNREVGAVRRPAEPEFERAVELIARLQTSRGIGMRVVPGEAGQATTLLGFRDDEKLGAEVEADLEELRRLLRLAPGVTDVKLLYGVPDPEGRTIAVQTRSIMQVLLDLAGDVDVPPAHLDAGYARKVWEEGAVRQVRIRSGSAAPPDAYAAVEYRDTWFWIDQDDLRGKATFTFMMVLFRLKAGRSTGGGPILTIPTG